MRITIEELFSDIKFESIIKEKWRNQYQKNGKIQSNTKKAIISELLKQYESAKYIRGNKNTKACFEIGNKRDSVLSSADMIANGIKKSNINSYKVIAFQIFKNFIANQKLNGVSTQSMPRLQWLKNAGITSDLKDLYFLDQEKIDDRNSPNFIKYYKYDLTTYLKSIFEYCVDQLNIDSQELYYCDSIFDDEIEIDENGIKKRLLETEEVEKYNQFRNEIKEKYEVKNFYNAPKEFNNDLSNYIEKNFKSNKIWVEIELNYSNIDLEFEDTDIDNLRKIFMKEFQIHRNQLYINREFKKGKGWRYEALISPQQSKIIPYRQMEERNYYRFMSELDEKIGFNKADDIEYKKMLGLYSKDKKVMEIKELINIESIA
jgi:hypothetical protein